MTYISHYDVCLNPKCRRIVSSRHSGKCPQCGGNRFKFKCERLGEEKKTVK